MYDTRINVIYYIIYLDNDYKRLTNNWKTGEGGGLILKDEIITTDELGKHRQTEDGAN